MSQTPAGFQMRPIRVPLDRIVPARKVEDPQSKVERYKIRLELVAHHYNAESIFLLAGKRADLVRLFRTDDFAGPAHPLGRNTILNISRNLPRKVLLGSENHFRAPLVKSALQHCQNVAVPKSIVTRRTEPFPLECRMNQFQVFAWDITPAVNRRDFIPANVDYFRATPH